MDEGLIFPDPLPPPQNTKIHSTRSDALNGAGVNIATTAQLVPVVLPLIEMVLDTQVVHDELDEGVKEAKERVKEERERAKAIREQWDLTKKNGNPVKHNFSVVILITEADAGHAFRRTRPPVQSTIALLMRSSRPNGLLCTRMLHVSLP